MGITICQILARLRFTLELASVFCIVVENCSIIGHFVEVILSGIQVVVVDSLRESMQKSKRNTNNYYQSTK